MEYYLKIKDQTYLKQSLNHYGILLQNNCFNIVKPYVNTITSPHVIIDEGILFQPSLSDQIRVIPNARVYKDNILVFEKITNDESVIDFYDSYVYDLYNILDKQYVDDILVHYENNRKIYIKNTEIVNVDDITTRSLAGLASGTFLAETAYKLKLNHIVYYDFSAESIQFQKDLLSSSDRKQTFIDNLSELTLGYLDASMDDIDKLNFSEIDIYYDYLKTITVDYGILDLRLNDDVVKLFNMLSDNSTIWISNVLHYVSMLNYYNEERYKLIDNIAEAKNIKILPHTRIYYES